MSASITVESTRTARPMNLLSRWALAITSRVISSTVSCPSRLVSLRIVDSSGTRMSRAIKKPAQMQRVRTPPAPASRSPSRLRCLTTINRT